MRETTTPVSFRANAVLLAAIDVKAKKDGLTRAEVAKLCVEAICCPPKADGTIANKPKRAPMSMNEFDGYASPPLYARPTHEPTCNCGICQAKRG